MLKKIIIVSALLVLQCAMAIPIKSEEEEDTFLEAPVAAPNITVPKDLYVIKTYVYEIGILTDAGNDTNSTEITNEEINLKFFNRPRNGSNIDLNNIPFPFLTNISGASLAGIAPVNFGAIKLSELSTTLKKDTTTPDQQDTSILSKNNE